MTCAQELCLNWTGMGCACQVYDLEPNIVEADVDWNVAVSEHLPARPGES